MAKKAPITERFVVPPPFFLRCCKGACARVLIVAWHRFRNVREAGRYLADNGWILTEVENPTPENPAALAVLCPDCCRMATPVLRLGGKAGDLEKKEGAKP